MLPAATASTPTASRHRREKAPAPTRTPTAKQNSELICLEIYKHLVAHQTDQHSSDHAIIAAHLVMLMTRQATLPNGYSMEVVKQGCGGIRLGCAIKANALTNGHSASILNRRVR